MVDRLTSERVEKILAGDTLGLPVTPETVGDFLLAMAGRNGNYLVAAYEAAGALDRFGENNAEKIVAATWLIVNAVRHERPELRDALIAAVPHLLAELGKGNA